MTAATTPATDELIAEIEADALANHDAPPLHTLSLIARIHQEREKAGWQPIETAPRDGTAILLYCPQGDGTPDSTYRVTVGDWCEDYGGVTENRDLDGRWIGQDESEGFIGWLSWDGGFSEDTMLPTHWQPLPRPPVFIDGGSK